MLTITPPMVHPAQRFAQVIPTPPQYNRRIVSFDGMSAAASPGPDEPPQAGQARPVPSPPGARGRGRVAAAVLLGALCVLASAAVVRRANRPPAAGPDVSRIPFGRQRAGAVLDLECLLDNRSARSLAIADVRTTCGCTTMAGWPRQVEPHSSLTLPVRLQLPPDHHGPFYTRVVVTFAGPKPAPARSFVIEGDVFLPCPPEVNFGTLKRGDPAARTFVVRSTTPGKALRILSARCGEERFDVKYAQARENAEDAEVTVTLATPRVEGTVDGDLTLHTDDPAEPVKHVRLKAYVLQPVETDLAQVSFGPVDGPETRSASLRLYSPYDEPFDVGAIRLEPAGLLRADTARDAEGRAVIVTLTLRGPLPEQSMEGWAKVDVQTEAGPRVIEVALYAHRPGPASIPAQAKP